MFYLLLLIVLIGIFSVATYFVINEPGYIMLQWGGWQVELSLVLVVVAIVLLILVLYVGLEILSSVVSIPGRLGRTYREYRERKNYAASVKGIQHLLLGDWTKAERLLDDSAARLPEPVVSYLAAAYAAQQQGSITRRDLYLNKARKLGNHDQSLVAMVDSRLRIEQGEYSVAIKELKKLCAKMPKNTLAFKLLAEAYEQTQDWESLGQLLPHLQKTQAKSSKELNELSANVARHRLRAALTSADLQKIWKSAKNPVKMNESVISTYVRRLFEFDRHEEIDKVIRDALNRRWSSELVYLYGMVDGEMKSRHLYDTALGWLEKHPNDPDLLLTAGKFARKVGLKGKAQTHLRHSIELGGRKDAYEELGALLEDQDKNSEAFGVYKTGIAAPRN